MVKKPRPRQTAAGRSDPLGKLIKEYRPSASAVLGSAAGVFLLGIGVLVYCQFQTPYPWALLPVGVVMLLAAPALLVLNVFNVGKSFQVRKNGVRYLDGGAETS